MATQKLVSKSFNVHNAMQFVESLSEPQNDQYYLFFGKHTEYVNGVVEPVFDSQYEKIVSVYDEMILGKKVASSDVTHMVDKIMYSYNTPYTMYDDQALDLHTKEFYAAVANGANYRVYKCLFNNNGANTGSSGTEPTGTSDAVIFTSDGYAWKYMYTIDSATWAKYTTTAYMPVLVDADARANAIGGSVEIILINDGGTGYTNHTSGTFTAADIQPSGVPTDYILGNSASAFNDFYKNCIIEVTTGASVEYRTITSYNGATKKATIDLPFTVIPTSTSTYRVFPQVKIYGDGSETIEAQAWALVNATSSNTVYKIEVLPGKEGAGYRKATTKVLAANVVSVAIEANVRSIISPAKGHGYDPVQELNANKVCVSVKVSNNESGSVISSNDYRTIGVLKNPKFANVYVTYTGGAQIFDVGETVYQYRPIEIAGTAAVNTAVSNTTLTGTSTQFSSALQVGDKILISNSTTLYYNTVNAIANSTQLTLGSAIASNIASMKVSIVRTTGEAKVKSYGSGELFLTEADSTFAAGELLIGTQSFTKITIATIQNNGRSTNDFNTFMQLIKFTGSAAVGTFAEDALVYQANFANTETLPTANVFFQNSSTLWVTNETNKFANTGNVISGNAVFVVNNKYPGDLIKDSGEILYIENVSVPLVRDSTTNEKIKLILEF